MFRAGAEHIELSKYCTGQSWFSFCRQNFFPHNNGNFRRCIEHFSLYQHIKMPEQTQRSISRTHRQKHTQMPLFVHVFRLLLFLFYRGHIHCTHLFYDFDVFTFCTHSHSPSLSLYSCWLVFHFSLSRGAYIYLIKIWQCSYSSTRHTSCLAFTISSLLSLLHLSASTFTFSIYSEAKQLNWQLISPNKIVPGEQTPPVNHCWPNK